MASFNEGAALAGCVSDDDGGRTKQVVRTAVANAVWHAFWVCCSAWVAFWWRVGGTCQDVAGVTLASNKKHRSDVFILLK